MNQTVDLSQQATGFQGVIVRIGGDKVLKRKLMSLGIRQGQHISVLHQRKNGVVVLSNSSRVALGSGIAANVFLEPVADRHGQQQP
jgi:Fe2+ transport system protein FeoA